VSGTLPSALTVELVSGTDGSVVKSWAPEPPAAGEVKSVTWSGRIGRSTATPGRYSFRLTAATASGAVARSAQAGDLERDAFDLYDHVFPVRGRHDYGGSGAGFGSGRAGHSHQGHDVFAKCGTRMVAARGGRVKFEQYHAAAGHYIVVDGAGTDVDYAYMHLSEPSPFQPGDRVFTGQQIGAVGDSGNAQGCHLHFELWSGPGWYDGGDPFDPLPALQAWDSWS
jgi:murein DD-endopeptidase MepM/ murein hydrolase activator NlpD